MDKKYVFEVEGGITFSIEFQKGNFHHLLGLHKLTDKQILNTKDSRNDPVEIYEKILSGEITPGFVEQSANYYKIENRIKYFEKIFDTLDKNKCKIIIDFDSSKIENCSLKKTKYILYVRMPEGYFLFTLGMVRKNRIYPETLFFESSAMYNNNQTLLDVYDIRVVEDRNGKRKNKKT